jgi:SulP family sulfate permease
VADHPEAELTPGLLAYRFDAPLFFANASRLRDEIQAAVDAAEPPVECVVIDAEMMYDIDSTGAQILLELLDGLDEQGVRLVFARVRTELRDELRNSGLEERVGADRIYLEVDDAVTAFVERKVD